MLYKYIVLYPVCGLLVVSGAQQWSPLVDDERARKVQRALRASNCQCAADAFCTEHTFNLFTIVGEEISIQSDSAS